VPSATARARRTLSAASVMRPASRSRMPSTTHPSAARGPRRPPGSRGAASAGLPPTQQPRSRTRSAPRRTTSLRAERRGQRT
jgi:hypothetical protein